MIGVVSAKLVGLGFEGIALTISTNTGKLYLDRLLAGEVISD